MGKELNRIKKMASGAGIDVDILVKEIANEVAKVMPPPPVPVDEDSLMTKFEARFAAKIGEVLEAVKGMGSGEKVDTQAVIEGLAQVLQPQIVEIARKTVADAFNAEKNSFYEALNQRAEAEAKKTVPTTPTGDGGTTDVNIIALANTLFDKWLRYKEVTKSGTADAETMFKWLNLGLRMGKGGVDAESFISAAKEITKPAS